MSMAAVLTPTITEPLLSARHDKVLEIDDGDSVHTTKTWLLFEKTASKMSAGERMKNHIFRKANSDLVQSDTTTSAPQSLPQRRAQGSSSADTSQELLPRESSCASSCPPGHDSQGTSSAERGGGDANQNGTCQLQNTQLNSARDSSTIPVGPSSLKKESDSPAGSSSNGKNMIPTIEQPKFSLRCSTPLTPPRSLTLSEVQPPTSQRSAASKSNSSSSLTPPPEQSPERRSSGDTVSTSSTSTCSVVRGFNTSLKSISSASRLVMAPTQVSKALPTPVMRKNNMFSLGGTASSNDDDSPMDSVPDHRSQKAKQVKHTTFNDTVQVRQSAESVSDNSDISDSAVDSAIEDDDDWEDDSGSTSPQPRQSEPPVFQRTQSAAKLRPNTSNLSALLKGDHLEHAHNKMAAMQTSGSRRHRTSNGPSTGNSFEDRPEFPQAMMASRSRLSARGPSGLPSAPDLTAITGPQGNRNNLTRSGTQTIPVLANPRQIKTQMVHREIPATLMKNLIEQRNIKTREIKAASNLKRSLTSPGELSEMAAKERKVNGGNVVFNEKIEVSPEEQRQIDEKLARDFSDVELNRYFHPTQMDYHNCGW